MLAARTRAVRDRLAHFRTMRDLAGLVLAVIAGAGVLGALALPSVRNTALER